MKITKAQLKQIIKEVLEEDGFGGSTDSLGVVAGRGPGADSPDAFLQRPSTPDSAIQGAAHEFFMNLGITDSDVVRALVSNIAVSDLKEIMRIVPKLNTAQEEPQ